MSSLELCAKKATVRCSEEAAACLLDQVKQMQVEWDLVQAAVAEEKAQLESLRMQLTDYDDAMKRELAWMQGIEQYFANTTELCADLAEKKCRLQRTKVKAYVEDLLFPNCKSLYCMIYWMLALESQHKGYNVPSSGVSWLMKNG